jgi:hypothetical protein
LDIVGDVAQLGHTEVLQGQHLPSITFDGTEFTSKGRVKVPLVLEEYRSYPLLFNIAPKDCPFRIIFGFDFLLTKGLVILKDVNEIIWPIDRKALVLAKKPNSKC